MKRFEGGRRFGRGAHPSPRTKPFITVITSTYNAACYLADAVRSVRGQNYDDFEWIIADGGSSDDTLEQLRQNDDLIDYWVSEPDRGIYNAWNKALAMSAGDWVCFLGADDFFWQPDVLSRFAQVLPSIPDDIRLAYGRVMLVDCDCQPLVLAGDDWSMAKSKYPYGVSIPHVGMMHRASLLRERGGFDESYRIAADHDLVLGELLHRDAFFIPELIVAGVRMGGVSSSSSSVLAMFRECRRAHAAHGLPSFNVYWCLAYAKVFIRLAVRKLVGQRLSDWVMSSYRRYRYVTR